MIKIGPLDRVKIRLTKEGVNILNYPVQVDNTIEVMMWVAMAQLGPYMRAGQPVLFSYIEKID